MDRHDPSWQERLAGGPLEADALLASIRPLVSQVVVRPFVEAYRIVADVLADDARLTDRDELIRRALGLGRQYVAQRRLRSSEAVSALLFQTALQLADNKGLLETGPDVVARRADFLAELRALLRRLDQVESIALRRYLTESVSVPLI
jgi:glycerol-3-phosphate O-acyltransferase